MFLFKTKTKQEEVGVPCHFGYSFPHQDGLYACFIQNQEQINNNIDQLRVFRPHGPQQSNDTVQKVEFLNCRLTKVPSGLKKIFPNFHTLVLEHSDIAAISNDDLKEYKDLKKFFLSGSKLYYLPGNLFENFDNIEHIEFCTEFTLIEPDILDGLNNLKQVSFYGIQNYYSIFYRANRLYDEDITLDELKAYLHDKLIERYKPLQDLSNSETKLKDQVNELQKIKNSLSQQVENLKKLNETYSNDSKQQKNSNDSLKLQIANLETKIENKQVENKQLRIFGERQKQEVRELKAEKSKISQELQKLKEVQTKLTQQVQKLKTTETKLNSENNELRNSKSKVEKQLEQFINSEKKLNLQVEHLKTIEKNLREKNQELEKMKATLAYDLTSYTQNETTKDFKIIIDGREFPVHKFLIIARSPTLAEILKNNPEVENLNLIDISVEIFGMILKFLYTDELPGDDSNFLHLFAAAGKLKIQKLVDHAAKNLIDQVDCENALEILRISASFKLQDLKLKAFKLLKEKYCDMKFEDEWLDNPEKLIKVVAMLKKKEEILKKFDEEFKVVTSNK